MLRIFLKTISLSFAITILSAILAIVANLIRNDGIDLIADTPYEIFSECRDSTAISETISSKELNTQNPPIYIDARPKDVFIKSHAMNAINIPYSPLFGAARSDIKKLTDIHQKDTKRQIVVYGLFKEQGLDPVDFAEPLATQLVEIGFKNVKHMVGGLDSLKQQGVTIVEAKKDDQ